jgi:hypothetical protein
MVIYEWDVQVANSHGEVVHCEFCESFAEAVRVQAKHGSLASIVLVREDCTADTDRLSYAAVSESLPDYFTGEDGEPVAEVPAEFHEEVQRSGLAWT